MYLKELMIKLYDLNSRSKATCWQYQRVEAAISAYGTGAKDRHFDAEYHTMYPQSVSTPNTVRSVSRDQMDSNLTSTNVVIKPSDMGRLTEE